MNIENPWTTICFFLTALYGLFYSAYSKLFLGLFLFLCLLFFKKHFSATQTVYRSEVEKGIVRTQDKGILSMGNSSELSGTEKERNEKLEAKLAAIYNSTSFFHIMVLSSQIWISVVLMFPVALRQTNFTLLDRIFTSHTDFIPCSLSPFHHRHNYIPCST